MARLGSSSNNLDMVDKTPLSLVTHLYQYDLVMSRRCDRVSAIVVVVTLCFWKHALCNNTCYRVPTNHMDAALKIWNYLQVRDKLEKSDLILALGSYDKRVAIEAARLLLEGYGDRIMFSGRVGNLTRGKWDLSEAEVFADVAISMGVPRDKIMLEKMSTNTGENLKFSYQILKSTDKIPRKLILVQKPYMGKRTYATFMKQWPGNLNNIKFMVTSPKISFADYPNEAVGDFRDVITVMIGDLQRVKLYSSTGFQIPLHITNNVWKTFLFLKEKNIYNDHLIKRLR